MHRIKLWIPAVIAVMSTVTAQPPVLARVTPAGYRDVGITVPANASIPPATWVNDDTGKRRSMRELVGPSTVLIFADYACRTLCGPIVAFVTSALEQSGLRPGEQFRLLVVGLDAKDGASDALDMRKKYLERGSPLDRASQFVTADRPTVQLLTAALGYRYAYDEDSDTYIHPAAAYVLNSDARVARVLTGIGLSAQDIRLALIEASEGKIGTFRDQIRLLCSGFDPAHGTYNLMIWRVLELATLATALTLVGGIGLLFLTGRRRPA